MINYQANLRKTGLRDENLNSKLQADQQALCTRQASEMVKRPKGENHPGYVHENYCTAAEWKEDLGENEGNICLKMQSAYLDNYSELSSETSEPQPPMVNINVRLMNFISTQILVTQEEIPKIVKLRSLDEVRQELVLCEAQMMALAARIEQLLSEERQLIRASAGPPPPTPPSSPLPPAYSATQFSDSPLRSDEGSFLFGPALPAGAIQVGLVAILANICLTHSVIQ